MIILTEYLILCTGGEDLSEIKKCNARAFIYNSLLLTCSAVLMRAVGVGYNVYLSNTVGSEVMGLYSLVTSVWGFALTLATSGINLAASRLVAEARNNCREMRSVMKHCTIYALSFGLGAGIILFFLSRTISVFWLSDIRAVLPLRIMSFSLPVISISSALSGYFSAVKRVWKSAAVQIIEQSIKIFGVAALLVPLLPRGIEFACIAIVLGGTIAEITSFLVYWFLYLSDRKRLVYAGDDEYCAGKRLPGRVLSVALPVALSAYIRSGLTTLEHTLIPYGLREFGLSQTEALETYGMLSGMVLPVVLFPYALINSFTGMLIPEISGGIAAGEKIHISYITTRVWRLTLIFGLCGAGVLAACSRELGWILYGSEEAGRYILYLAPLMPLMYLDTVTDSLLKGMGEQVYTMNVNIADAFISVILVWLLVPKFGINGYIAVLYFAELINFSFSACKLFNRCPIKFNTVRWYIMPLLGIIITARISVSLLNILNISAYNIPTLIGHIIFIIALYMITLALVGSFDREIRDWLKNSIGIRKRPD